ncbi:MAG: DUF1573 domain-containing protein [Deltaproteobacteria bacterium]|jgi:hypothetical protein|nr:DUF1573 domain-containing protein [Deltaproteobacteria bacterium]
MKSSSAIAALTLALALSLFCAASLAAQRITAAVAPPADNPAQLPSAEDPAPPDDDAAAVDPSADNPAQLPPAEDPAPPDDAAAAPDPERAPAGPRDELAAAAAPPKIVLPETDFDYGEAQPSTAITHEFLVRNEGEGNLAITDVVPGCGCSVVSFTNFIPAGHEGRITLTVDLYAEWAGHNVNKSATILSNDPENPTMRITMRARVLDKK